MAQVTIVFDSARETLADVVKQLTGAAGPVQLSLPMEDHKIPVRDSERVEAPAPAHDKAVQDFINMGDTTSDDLDADNVQWDERIHSSSKATTAKGVWKKRKGVDSAEHARITAELQSLEVAPAAPAPAAPAPAAPAPAAPAPAAPAPAAASAWTWPKMIKAITGGMRDKQFDAATVNAVLADRGIEELALLSPHVDKFDSVAKALNLVLPE
jgi:hypothetical protein